MSKTALKKLLPTLSPEEKDELLLDLYSARAEAKEYLDFFIDPDIDKLLDKTTKEIAKEINRRAKHNYLKPRVSRVRALIKKVATLNPGQEYVVELMVRAIDEAAKAGSGSWFSDAHDSAFARLLTDTIMLADKAGILAPTIEKLNAIIDQMPVSVFRNPASHFKSVLKTALYSALNTLTGEKK